MTRAYQHSGKYAPHGPILGFLAGAAISVPAAFAYDYAIFSIPEAKVRIICTIAFGALIGAVCGVTLCWAKVRNNTVATLAGLGSSLFGLYVSWLAWILHVAYPAHWLFRLTWPATHPRVMWHALLHINATGTWSFQADKPESGAVLAGVWIGEALLILGFGAFTAMALVKRRPFCERCEQWCTERLKLYFAPTLTFGQFKTLVESDDLSNVAKVPTGNRKQGHFRLDLHTCGTCHTLSTLSLVQNFPRNHKTVVDKLLLSPEQTSLIRNLELTQRASATASTAPASVG